MQHVEVIAERAHPAGSEAMAHVARYLDAQLRGLGLETRPQVFRDGRVAASIEPSRLKRPGH